MARSPLSIGKFLLIFISWWLIWTLLQTMLLLGFGLDFGIAIADSLVSNTLLALSCGFISNNLQYYLPKKERYWYILLVSLGLSGLILLSCKGILVPLFSEKTGDNSYAQFFSRSWPVRFDIIFLQVGCMTILSVLWYSSEEEQQNLQRRADAERLSKEAELFKLRQQLAPHFLFNSLNSISALVGSQPEQARKMIQQLSDFLRGNLKKEEQQWVLFSEELQYLELYLDIEKVRFGHRLTTVINHDLDSLDMRLPPMLLQPIVENAIKFGLYDTTEAVTISITARAEERFIRISVQNPFDPETSRPSKGAGFGLSSIQRRLYLLFARADLLETRIENNLFTTIVKIPQFQIPPVTSPAPDLQPGPGPDVTINQSNANNTI
ncbi:MAG TPA: histidine kinase [Puia sp.]|nr:histidine kinase [Puia sp.]